MKGASVGQAYVVEISYAFGKVPKLFFSMLSWRSIWLSGFYFYFDELLLRRGM
jgi:hypothetical protein